MNLCQLADWLPLMAMLERKRRGCGLQDVTVFGYDLPCGLVYFLAILVLITAIVIVVYAWKAAYALLGGSRLGNFCGKVWEFIKRWTT